MGSKLVRDNFLEIQSDENIGWKQKQQGNDSSLESEIEGLSHIVNESYLRDCHVKRHLRKQREDGNYDLRLGECIGEP